MGEQKVGKTDGVVAAKVYTIVFILALAGFGLVTAVSGVLSYVECASTHCLIAGVCLGMLSITGVTVALLWFGRLRPRTGERRFTGRRRRRNDDAQVSRVV
jgi:hypothetical protein